MIFIYKIIGFILIPLIKINTKKRIKNNKELSSRFKERFGISSIKLNNEKKIIWIHAASVGEFKSTDHLIRNYYKKYTLLITTTTVSAANYAEKKYGNKIIHQFAPFDVNIWVDRFLKNWDPFLVIWIESDLWPVTLHSIKNLNINAILVNLRLSPNSFKKWKLFPTFYNNLMHCFSDIFAQSKNDQERVESLSNKKIKFIGNLKLTASNYPEINNITESKKINIMFASTHKDEEEKLLSIFSVLNKKYKNLKLIIAPRHPERSKEIIYLCTKYKLSSKLESEINKESDDINIIDSFGILHDYFAISDIVFLGGSLVPAGGHNPIEPATNKCAIITGNIIFNWQNIFDDMIKSDSCSIVKSSSELKKELINLIDNQNEIKKMKRNAYNFAKKQFIDTKLLDETINKYMENK